MTGGHHVYIIERAREGKTDETEFLVRPAIASVDRGHKDLSIRNLTEHEANIRFPVSAGLGDVRIGDRKTARVDLAHANSGFFEYEVELLDTPGGKKGGTARGESVPGVILDP
jgi:hypothetical protein